MIVIARSYGQLGNRLFLYAHMIAAAQEYGVQLANPCFAEYARFFPATADDLWCRYPRRPTDSAPPSLRVRKSLAKTIYLTAKALATIKLHRYPFHVLRITGQQTYDLSSKEFAAAAKSDRDLLALGWLFRSESLLLKHRDVIREHLAITQPHRDRVDQCVGAIRQQSDVIVGVHVRHGDYASFMDGRYYYSTKQFANAMHRIADQLPGQRVAFLVCSNSKLDRRDFSGLRVHFGPGHMIEDMYSMAKTDLLIGPPSTYTGWAAFYGGLPAVSMETADEPIDLKKLLPKQVSQSMETPASRVVREIAVV